MRRPILEFSRFRLAKDSDVDAHHTVKFYSFEGKYYALKRINSTEAAIEKIKYDLLDALKVTVPETFVVRDSVRNEYFIAS